MAYSGEMQWRTRAGDEIAARLGEPLTKDLTAQALRTALDPHGVVDAVGAGRGGPPADRGTPPRARRRRAGDRHRPGLRARLRRAAEADQRGASRPSCCRTRRRRRRGSRTFTESDDALDGRGADGVRGRRRAPAGGRRLRHHHLDAAVLRPGRRPLRARPGAGRDRVGVPAVGARRCSGFAAEMEVERDHVLGRKITDEDDIFAAEEDLLGAGERGESASPTTCSASFEALGSEARFDRVLYDGGEFGHAGEVHVGSEEEMDFLGIPGLLEPDQVRELLHHRQRSRRTGAAGCPTRPTPERELSTHEQLAAAATRAQRPRRRLAPPHRPGARRHPCRAAQGVRRPRRGGRQRRAAPRADQPAARVGGQALSIERIDPPERLAESLAVSPAV